MLKVVECKDMSEQATRAINMLINKICSNMPKRKEMSKYKGLPQEISSG